MFGFFKRKSAPPPTTPVDDSQGKAEVAPNADRVVAQDVVPVTAPAISAPVPPGEPIPERKSWLAKLKGGLSKTSNSITTLFTGTRIEEGLYDELEAALLMADTGVDACNALLTELKAVVKQNKLTEPLQVREALREIVRAKLIALEKPVVIDKAAPTVWMIAGVNGAGKTTSIGKLAHLLQAENKSVLLAAGDTFRAAAREQLAVWGQRNNVHVIAQEGGDPAAVAFDAVSSAKAKHIDVVMVDTAGRLPTQAHLMEELKKIRRVIGKAMEGAPHECLLVLDGNTGQNMLAQVKAFDESIGLTGLIITKLDGTAKGGAILALATVRKDRPIPVYFIGVGETMHDLEAFSAVEFTQALL